MKFKLFLAGLFALLCFTVSAQTPQSVFSGVGTLQSNANDCVSYYVATKNSITPGPPVLGYASYKSDIVAGVLRFYTVTNEYALTTTNSGGQTGTGYTNLATVNSIDESGLASNTVVLIRHKSTDTYERARTFSVTTSNIQLQAGSSVTTVTDGDILYACGNAGSILVGATAATLGPIGTGGGIANGVFKTKPFLMELTGSNGTGTTLNFVSGYFAP